MKNYGGNTILARTKGEFVKGSLQQQLARTFGGSYSCPPLPPDPHFSALAPQAPPPSSTPLHLPPTQTPSTKTQAHALATPGANYPLTSAWKEGDSRTCVTVS